MHNSTMESTSTLIPPQNVPQFLPHALPWLERTIRDQGYAKWDLDVLVSDLQSGALQLWGAKEGNNYLWVITDIVYEPAGRCVQIILAGGTLDEEKAILRHIDLIEQWAKNFAQAVAISVWGRLGWKKLLQPYGYSFETALFRKAFTDRMH